MQNQEQIAKQLLRRRLGLDEIRAELGSADGYLYDKDNPGSGLVNVRYPTSNGLSLPPVVNGPIPPSVPRKIGSKILLRFDANDELYIAGPDSKSIKAAGTDPNAYTQPPAGVAQQSIATLAPTASNPPDTIVHIKAWAPIIAGTVYQFPGAQIDLGPSGSNLLPSAGNKRYVVIFVKADFATLEAKGSTVRGVLDTELSTADIQECLDAKTAGSLPVWAIPLYDNPSTVKQSDIDAGVDLRNIVNTNDAGLLGNVTSVALTADPTDIFNVSGSPITTSGTLALSLDDQSSNMVLAGPTTGSAATPAFRALVAADIPNLDASKIATGALAVANGGTGQTTALTAFNALSPLTTKGDLLTRNSTNNIRVAVGSDGAMVIADASQAAGIRWGNNPTIASFANANHNHQDAAGGGTLDAAAIASGTFANARVNWAAPSAIGTTTPAAGTFTTITVTGGANPSQTWKDGSGNIVASISTAGHVAFGQAAAPSVTLDVLGGALIDAGASDALTVTATGGTPVVFEVSGAQLTAKWDTYVGSISGSTLLSRKSRGTKASPAVLGSGDRLFEIDMRGYNGSAWSGEQSALIFDTQEAWSTTAQGTGARLYLTQLGTTSPYQAMYLTSTNNGILTQDAGTTSLTTFLLGHNSSATPAAGFGLNLFFLAKSSTTNDQNMALWQAYWTEATHASRKAQLDLHVYDTTSRLAISVAASGSAAQIAFLGAPVAARQTGGAATAGVVYAATEQGMLQKAYDALRTFGFLT